METELVTMTSETINKDDINIVLYHGSCSDGYGSAFVVWLYYKRNYGLERANEIEYIPCYHQKEFQLSEDFLNKLKNKNVLMCDFSYKYDQLVKILYVAKSFIIIDHHKTAEADLQRIPEHLKIFDMKSAGCGITWNFFYPETALPRFLEFVQDRDLWTYKFNNTSEFVAFFYEQDFNFEHWEKFLSDNMVDTAITTGSAWLQYKNILVDKMTKRTSYVIQEINGHYVIVLYCNSSEFKSDIGNAVFKKFPMGDFSCVWDYDLHRQQSSYSLRSTNDRFDVSAIAKKLGGGGHRNASGISLSGMVGCLPFDIIEDPDLLRLLHYNTKGVVNFGDSSYTYTLFKVKEIRQEWFKENYFNLLKRKCGDSILLVFEQMTDKVNVIDDSVVVPLKQYSIFYNEKALKQPEKQLQFLVCVQKDCALVISETEKEFHEIFNGDLDICTDSENSDSDSEDWSNK